MSAAVSLRQVLRHGGAQADYRLDIPGCRDGEHESHGRGVQRTAILSAMAGDASSLHCPNCGAAVDPGRQAAVLHRASGDRELSLLLSVMFEGAAFCSSCGAGRARDLDPGAAPALSRCKGTMPRSGAATPSFSSVRSVTGSGSMRRPSNGCARARGAGGGAAPVLDPDAKAAAVRYRKCARCPQLMNRRQLRPSVRGDCRRLPRPWHLSRRRRASPDRQVHPFRRPGASTPASSGGAEGARAPRRRRRAPRRPRGGRSEIPSASADGGAS